jgi:hypothetical protein
MTRRLVLGFLVATFSLPAGAQIHSVQLFGSYSAAVGKRLAVVSADAPGGGVEVRVRLSDHLMLSFIGGFERYTINQDSALEQWNWRFWEERYRGIVQDNLASDSSLSAVLTPVQAMEVLPLLVTLDLEFTPVAHLSVRPSAGVGVWFYTRSLYLHEEWQKRFNSIGYTFDYSYRNFAQDKKGTPFVGVGRLEVAYQVNDIFEVNTTARFTTAFATEGRLGYDEFPLKDIMTYTIGLSLLY